VDSASHNIDLVPELPAVSLGRLVCLVYLAILVCQIFPTLTEEIKNRALPTFRKLCYIMCSLHI